MIELSKLLEYGYSFYNIDSSTSEEDIKNFIKELNNLDYSGEKLLTLVNDFAKHYNTIDDCIINNHYTIVFRFVVDYIKKLSNPLEKRKLDVIKGNYYNDYEVLASIYDFNLNPDQFWYLIQFCIFYVDSLTHDLSFVYPSIEEELLMIVDDINSMGFDGLDWREASPKVQGTLTLSIEGHKKKRVISNPKTLNLLSVMIKQFLERKRDEHTDFALTVKLEEDSVEYKRYKYLDNKKNRSKKEEQELRDLWPRVIMHPSETYTEESNHQWIALFHYYVCRYLNTAVQTNEDENPYYKKCKKGLGVSHDKTFLVSKLIYIFGLSNLSLKKNETIEERKERKQKFYIDSRYLKDYFLKGHEIKNQEDVDNYLKIKRNR